MFITLLAANFLVACAVCLVTVMLFRIPVMKVLKGRFSEDAASIWIKYIIFAVFVIGVSTGTRVWDMERYLSVPQGALGRDLMAFEVYKTAVFTLQVSALAMLLFLTAVWAASALKRQP